MKSKKQSATAKKGDDKNDDLLTRISGAGTDAPLDPLSDPLSESIDEPLSESLGEDAPVDITGLVGDDAEAVLPDEVVGIDPEKIDDAPAIDPMSMREFGVETEEAADPLSSEEKRYFMGEDEEEEDEEQAIIDESFTPEDYEQ